MNCNVLSDILWNIVIMELKERVNTLTRTITKHNRMYLHTQRTHSCMHLRMHVFAFVLILEKS